MDGDRPAPHLLLPCQSNLPLLISVSLQKPNVVRLESVLRSGAIKHLQDKKGETYVHSDNFSLYADKVLPSEKWTVETNFGGASDENGQDEESSSQ
jgi:hypothetical protein